MKNYKIKKKTNLLQDFCITFVRQRLCIFLKKWKLTNFIHLLHNKIKLNLIAKQKKKKKEKKEVQIKAIKRYNSFEFHCIEYARIRVFTDPHSPVWWQGRRFCPYAREYGSLKTRILTCFMHCCCFPLSNIHV